SAGRPLQFYPIRFGPQFSPGFPAEPAVTTGSRRARGIRTGPRLCTPAATGPDRPASPTGATVATRKIAGYCLSCQRADCAHDAPVLRAIASEEFHIRETHGDHPDAAEYAREYGLSLFDRKSNPLTDTIAGKIKVLRDLPPDVAAPVEYLLPKDRAGVVIGPA